MIGAKKTPFAVSYFNLHLISRPQCIQVKSGGHTMNPGFSSTRGIQIYTRKFSQVTYDPATSTAVIGTGLVWDTVYEKLQDHGVNVLGGRLVGVSERRNFLGRSVLNPCWAIDRRGGLAARRRFVPGDSPAFCTLTDHR